jgi:hypothetical protein
MKDTGRIIALFEAELKAGNNPSLKEYNRRYNGLDDDTLGTMIVLRALYDNKENMKLPEGFKEKQRKFVQDMIKRNPRQ